MTYNMSTLDNDDQTTITIIISYGMNHYVKHLTQQLKQNHNSDYSVAGKNDTSVVERQVKFQKMLIP